MTHSMRRVAFNVLHASTDISPCSVWAMRHLRSPRSWTEQTFPAPIDPWPRLEYDDDHDATRLDATQLILNLSGQTSRLLNDILLDFYILTAELAENW